MFSSAIIKCKTIFLQISNIQYFLLVVEDSTFSVQELSRKEAISYIEENSFSKVYSSSQGCIYATPNTKDILSKCPFLDQIYIKLDAI